jgi:sugar/nucleoside kinase (ribokinase family)
MTLHGTGCCLIDYLYASIDFSSPAFAAARSRREGDGGLTPGRLVFAEDFERFAGKPYEKVLAGITGGKAPTTHNLGGPSVVALAHAAQLLHGRDEDASQARSEQSGASSNTVRFYGIRGDDATGALVAEAVSRLPFDETRISVADAATPRTDVLSDPRYDGGYGERTFINVIGAAGMLRPDDLDRSLFDADLVAFGGTGLVPPLHDGITALLRKARKRGAATVVNLVYDFRSELTAPGKKWRLGLDDDAYPHIDLLAADREEALKTSGCADTETAIAWFLAAGVGAVVVTDGSRDVRLASRGGLFTRCEIRSMPVSEAVNEELRSHPERRGDTTGCGDNFVGGLLASCMEQLSAAPAGRLDLTEACAWAIASGGFACFTIGGTYYETRRGEKRDRIKPYLAAYRQQWGKEGTR